MSEGLDPRQRRLSRERARRLDAPPAPEDVPLDPPFPYRIVPFDPWTFGLQNDPPPPVFDTGDGKE